MPSATYRALAHHYDHLFSNEKEMRAARSKVLYPIMKQVSSACDLACGTGTFAVQLALQGLEMYAVDQSPDMVRLAKKKAAESKVQLRVQQGDMRTFRLPKPVDLVTCEFDAINHVPRKSDLARVVRSVSRALLPGGYFVFDANNRRAFETVWANTWFIENGPVALVMRGDYKPGTDKAAIDVEIFARKGKLYERLQERISEVCWSAEEIGSALSDAGFVDIRTWDAAPFFKSEFTLPGNRTYWRARKRNAK